MDNANFAKNEQDEKHPEPDVAQVPQLKNKPCLFSTSYRI